MNQIYIRRSAYVVVAALWPISAFAQTSQDIRIVTYNTQDDVSTPTPAGALPNLATVLEGVGQEKYVGDNILQLPDIIALQETTSNSTTVVPLASDLNTYYGSNIFSTSTYTATTSDGDTDGGGPNGLIYNQNTINLVASVGVGTPTGGSGGNPGNGEFRQVVRYEFQPIADKGTLSGIFYVYDSHYKSGAASTTDDNSTDGAMRNLEAQLIRNDEAANLPANAAVLYVGDYNLDGSTEAMYQTLTAVKSPSGVSQGQAFDPLNPTDNYTETWEENSTYKGIMTESDDDLRYRDDLQTMTSNVFNDTAGNLDYIANSYHAFGNNNSTAEGGNIDSPTSNPSENNSALNDIIGNGSLSPNTVLNAMNNKIGSDHLPVVADYSLALPSQTLTWDNAGSTLINDGMTWDVNHFLNWTRGSTSTTYTDGSMVTFNDTNNSHYAVTLNTTVMPGSVTFNTTATTYSIGGTGVIAGTGSLTKTGTGTATISTPNTYSGGTFVSGGTLVIAPTTVANTVALPDGAVSIGAAGTLKLADNATVSSPGNVTNQLLQMSSLSITPGGVLDVRNNHFYLADPGGIPDDSTYTSILGYVESNAITSTEGTSGYGVGVVDGNDSIPGTSVSSGQIEVAYTLDGDANLDGKVDATDFGIFAPNFGATNFTLGWEGGDFNYDGKVDATDFGLFAPNFGQSDSGTAVSLPSANYAALDAFAAANGLSLTSVPEPASGAMMLVVGLGILRRRRRPSH